jgi:sarcosine oxidase subunit alpha
MYGVRPGYRAVVAGDSAGDIAHRLADAGVQVVAGGTGVRRVLGRAGVRAVELADGRRVEADLVVAADGWSAQTALWTMAGGALDFDDELDRFVVAGRDRADLAAVGGLVGDAPLDHLIDDASAVGRGRRTRTVAPHPVPKAPAPRPVPGAAVVDFSEDVTATDLRAAAAEGYRSVELAKRYTTATMGPTQGKYAAVNTAAVLGAATGRSIRQIGTPTARPPYSPVPLGALAGRRFHPVRYTPMHAWHVAAGAQMAAAGQWLRPQHYGDPVAEARAVRTGVGIIDVSTLGKFELSGSDVPRLLNALYVNRWSALAVGSVRYGAMCDEAGVVIDDGVTGRISESRYLMSATSSGADNVARAIEVYLQAVAGDWDVALTDVTDVYASVNVAGPHARTLLSRLAEGVDLSSEAFGYMRVREARLAGVDDCFMWRIGFTGELSYEVHVPAGYGLHVWHRLLAAGADLGVTPFGVEAQRILRIEKGHAVVGQDSDALTGPYSLGLGGMTRLDKPETVGAPELAWQAAHPERLPYVLVGLQPDNHSFVPPESSQILVGGIAVGRVTSSCWSPTLRRAVALAQLRPDLAVPGAAVEIRRTDGGREPALVQPRLAHVDPEGVRLRG